MKTSSKFKNGLTRAAFVSLIQQLPPNLQIQAMLLLESVAFKDELTEGALVAGPDNTRIDDRTDPTAGTATGSSGFHCFAVQTLDLIPIAPVNVSKSISFAYTHLDTDNYVSAGSISIPADLTGFYFIGASGFFECGEGSVWNAGHFAKLFIYPPGGGTSVVFGTHWIDSFNAFAYPSGACALDCRTPGKLEVNVHYDTGSRTASGRVLFAGIYLGS